jgi:hypothetical protein
MRSRGEVSLSAFAFLFSEMVQYAQERSQSVDDMTRRLELAGNGIGKKVLEMQCWREKPAKSEGKRYNRLIELLTFVSQSVWKGLFGKAADSLEKVDNADDEYMILEADPVTNAFISVPPDMGNFNCAAFVAGIVAGILESASFPATVTAVTSRPEGGAREGTVLLIKFTAEVIDRELRLA